MPNDPSAILENIHADVIQLQQIVDPAIRPIHLAQSPDPSANTPWQLTESAPNPDDILLIGEFLREAAGHMTTAETHALHLQPTACDPESIACIYRSFHTIKSIAGFLNLRQITVLSNEAESLLEPSSHTKPNFDADAIQLILESIDTAKAMLRSMKVTIKTSQPAASEPGLPDLLDRLHACAARINVTTDCRPSENHPSQT